MIITLTGENTFAAKQAEHQLIEAFAAKYGPAGIERVDGEELEVSRLPDLLQGATLFAPVRLVILKNISTNKSLLEPLTTALERTADETTVVIADSTLDKRTKLYKFLKSKSNFQDFTPLDEPKLAAWVQKVAKEYGAVISASDALYLVQRAGRDQWRLTHEVDKLAHYSPQISRETIELLVESAPEGTAFELLDAAMAGKSERVSALLAALKTEEDPYKLFGLLASQVHALAVVSTAGTRSADQIAKDAGIHPFVVRKTQVTANRLGWARIQRITQSVADCDWQLKSTGADPWQLLGKTLQSISNV
ncbi:MAG TPA: DNA polymerase III subunit delta [Candidatus Saccharimonadales bacterium]|nr:DNA polymerase III subunit delta [Candidatus Saccharimonadales bacterium]